jgi:hypothetical protein
MLISLELNGDSSERRCKALDCWFRDHEAVQVMGTQWVLISSLTASEIRRQLQALIDPADRLLVTQVGPMSFRNLIDGDVLSKGVG